MYILWCTRRDLNPQSLKAYGLKPYVYTNSTTCAHIKLWWAGWVSSPLFPKEPDLQSGAFADSLPTHIYSFNLYCFNLYCFNWWVGEVLNLHPLVLQTSAQTA